MTTKTPQDIDYWRCAAGAYAGELVDPLLDETDGLTLQLLISVKQLIMQAYQEGAVQGWEEGHDAGQAQERDRIEEMQEAQNQLAYERAHGPGRI
jgi:hypothetical protein